MHENQSKAQQQLSLGNAHKERGMLENAILCYQQGLTFWPGNAELWFNLATTLLALRRLPAAADALQQVIALRPDLAGVYNNLGAVLLELRRLPDAAKALQQAITLKPDFAEAYCNLGNALLKLQKPSEAIQALHKAIALKPDYAEAYINLGNVLQFQGKTDDAIAAYNHAIELNPTNAKAHINLAGAFLLSGNLVDGFTEYEWRTKVKPPDKFSAWCNDQPRWGGENFSGKRLLVYDEQGCGDTIQFCRYLPLVKARGGTVQFTTKQPLLRLFTDFPGIDGVIEHTEAAIAGTEFDLAVPLMSLPHIFGSTLPTIPANIPYLTVEQHFITGWRSILNCSDSNLRVGLAWGGNPAHPWGHIRDCGLKAMSSLADIPGVTFYSLQIGEATNRTKTTLPGMKLIDLTDDFEDFADTAALIMNLDLVISVDTAVAHLAGALGKPVWTLLPAAGEWRWLLARNDSPWYPTMRLFRQSAPGDWNSVITAVARELRTLV